jgi:hypothetical protein
MKFNLKSILLANATFSGASGIAMALFHNRLADFIGLSEPVALILIGLGLIVFSVFLFWLKTKANSPAALVNTVIVLDLFWVLGSVFVVVLKPFGLGTAGHVLIGGIAVVVFGFALGQWRYRDKRF